jgi:hypothetical protein
MKPKVIAPRLSGIKSKPSVSRAPRKSRSKAPFFVLMIGHSTRTLAEFIGLLKAHGATCVVDVRTVPRSRHNPQFNRDTLPAALRAAGIGYEHLAELGGFRHTTPDSPNPGWRKASFRGYADYMQTPAFAEGLTSLIQLASQGQIAVMCAEAVPWRCHRSLIADALLIRGIRSEDISSATRRAVHTLTPFAKVRGTTITYPAAAKGSPVKLLSAKRSRISPEKKSKLQKVALRKN